MRVLSRQFDDATRGSTDIDAIPGIRQRAATRPPEDDGFFAQIASNDVSDHLVLACDALNRRNEERSLEAAFIAVDVHWSVDDSLVEPELQLILKCLSQHVSRG